MTTVSTVDADGLAAAERALRASAAELRSRLEDPSPQNLSWCGDAADLAENAVEIERAGAAVDRDRDVLERVEAALDRIEAGTYGLCVVCGEPVAPERLQAVPQAATCVGCA